MPPDPHHHPHPAPRDDVPDSIRPSLGGTPAGRASLASALKRCPLCDALVVADAASCFVCEWHGEFLHDAELVSRSVDGLLARCPELVEAMIEEVSARTTVWERLRRSLAQSAARVFTVGIEPPLNHASLPPMA